jgi:hypothetical protein
MFIHNRVIMDIHPVEGELVGAGSPITKRGGKES